jgi:hypothetical protein
MDRDQRLAGGHERARIPTGSSGEVLPQGHDRQEADDADGDEGAIDETSGDIAQRERFALPLEDREQGDGGADVRDDEDLEERAQGRAPGGAGTDDVVGVVQHRRVEDGRRRDRGDEGDDEERAGDERGPRGCRANHPPGRSPSRAAACPAATRRGRSAGPAVEDDPRPDRPGDVELHPRAVPGA